MSSTITLKDRQFDATQKLIRSTAVELLETQGVNATTARAVAKQAGISERTIFRYYASREELLDAIADEATNRIQAPPPPANIDELRDFAAPLYACFEQWAPLLKEALHTEISKRVMATVAHGRWTAVRSIIDFHAPHRTVRDRKVAATNISYYLSASTWYYYRFNFELSAKDTERFAQSAINLFVEDILTEESSS
jgi:AcrR family transcriptional regulator